MLYKITFGDFMKVYIFMNKELPMLEDDIQNGEQSTDLVKQGCRDRSQRWLRGPGQELSQEVLAAVVEL